MMPEIGIVVIHISRKVGLANSLSRDFHVTQTSKQFGNGESIFNQKKKMKQTKKSKEMKQNGVFRINLKKAEKMISDSRSKVIKAGYREDVESIYEWSVSVMMTIYRFHYKTLNIGQFLENVFMLECQYGYGIDFTDAITFNGRKLTFPIDELRPGLSVSEKNVLIENSKYEK